MTAVTLVTQMTSRVFQCYDSVNLVKFLMFSVACSLPTHIGTGSTSSSQRQQYSGTNYMK